MDISLKMFSFKVFLFVILCFKGYETKLFLEIGNITEEVYNRIGINRPECGLRFRPIVTRMEIPSRCWYGILNDRDYYDNEVNNFFADDIVENYSERIYDGIKISNTDLEYTSVREAPWTVYYSHASDESSTRRWCSGVLIAPEWVLTAAHCYGWIGRPWWYIFGRGIGQYVYAGSPNRRVKYRVTHVFPYDYKGVKWENPKDSSSDDKDIMLLKIEPYDKSQEIPRYANDREYFINPICLPEADVWANDFEEKATVFGYGGKQSETFNALNPAYNLRKKDVTLLPFDKCGRDKDEDHSEIHLYCMRYGSHLWGRICNADHGGPLVQYTNGFKSRALLLGITYRSEPIQVPSYFQYDCEARDIQKTFFIPVAKFVKWILETTKKNEYV